MKQQEESRMRAAVCGVIDGGVRLTIVFYLPSSPALATVWMGERQFNHCGEAVFFTFHP